MESTNPASSLAHIANLEIQVESEWHAIKKVVRRICVDTTELADGSISNRQHVSDVTVTYGDDDTEASYQGTDEVTTRTVTED